ncbi:MAG: hypothetical protein AAGF81_22475, partial [Pseudomonadota bacterium]
FASTEAGNVLSAAGLSVMLFAPLETLASAAPEKMAAAVRRAAAAVVLCVCLNSLNACIDDARSTPRFPPC